MNFKEAINRYTPLNEQERQDKRIILNYIEAFPHNVLLRDNEIAHITSSGFIINPTLDKVLMVHHNIRNAWTWTGGHADGDTDLLYVALKEAKEETGVKKIIPLDGDIASVDIFPVYGHRKNGQYVSAHLHLSIAYLLIADESERLIVKEDENSGVRWFTLDQLTENYFGRNDLYLYNKLVTRAKQLNAKLAVSGLNIKNS